MFDRPHILGVVMAHGAAEATVLRHLPYWLRVCDQVEIWVPAGEGFPIYTPGAVVIEAVPNAGGYSAATSERTFVAMQAAMDHNHEFVMLLEYDAMVWGPIPASALPEHGAVAACRWPNEPHSPIPGKTFLGAFYLHFPHLYSRLALELTVGTIRQAMRFSDEHGYTDRFLGRAVELAGVPVRDWRAEGLAYSYENISKHPGRVLECIEAVRRGTLFSHGIKDDASLQRILAASPWSGLTFEKLMRAKEILDRNDIP